MSQKFTCFWREKSPLFKYPTNYFTSKRSELLREKTTHLTDTLRCTANEDRTDFTVARTFIRAENRLRCRAGDHYESSKGIRVAVKRRPDFTLGRSLSAITGKKTVLVPNYMTIRTPAIFLLMMIDGIHRFSDNYDYTRWICICNDMWEDRMLEFYFYTL